LHFNKANKNCQVCKLKLQLLVCHLSAGIVPSLCSLQQAALKGLVACRRAGTEAALGAMQLALTHLIQLPAKFDVCRDVQVYTLEAVQAGLFMLVSLLLCLCR